MSSSSRSPPVRAACPSTHQPTNEQSINQLTRTDDLNTIEHQPSNPTDDLNTTTTQHNDHRLHNSHDNKTTRQHDNNRTPQRKRKRKRKRHATQQRNNNGLRFKLRCFSGAVRGLRVVPADSYLSVCVASLMTGRSFARNSTDGQPKHDDTTTTTTSHSTGKLTALTR